MKLSFPDSCGNSRLDREVLEAGTQSKNQHCFFEVPIVAEEGYKKTVIRVIARMESSASGMSKH